MAFLPRFQWSRFRLIYQLSYSKFQNKTDIQRRKKKKKGTGGSTEANTKVISAAHTYGTSTI